MKIKAIKQIKDLKNKKVLLRVDFNCPIENKKIIDDTRIKLVLPTIKYLIKNQAKVILISHLGRPKHKNQSSFSLKPFHVYLRKIFLNNITNEFIEDCIGEKVEKQIHKMKAGDVMLLENLRFYKQEEENDLKFSKKLAQLADIYINDAFSVCHRKHASVSNITNFLPSYAGLLIEKEIKILSDILTKPLSPFVVIMGGKKISTKIGFIKNLLNFADLVLVGGALASNFLKANSYNIGKSIYEEKMIDACNELNKNKKIIMPIDFNIHINNSSKNKILTLDELNNVSYDFDILDIGDKTINLFSKHIKNAKIIIWNGPMGKFEDKDFIKGTKLVAQEVFNNKQAKIIIGGGDIIRAISSFVGFSKTLPSNIFLSTGGGAMLMFLSNKTLPGLKPLLFNK